MKTNNNTHTIELTISSQCKSLDILDRLMEEGLNATLESYQHNDKITIKTHEALYEAAKEIASRVLKEIL